MKKYPPAADSIVRMSAGSLPAARAKKPAQEGPPLTPPLPAPPLFSQVGGGPPGADKGVSISGVGVDHTLTTYFNDLKRRKHAFLVFRIDSARGIVVLERASGPQASHKEFVTCLPDGDCRYGIYDFPYADNAGGISGKIVFVLWSPTSAPVRAKMLYASTKDFFKTSLDGVSVEIQATDESDVEEAAIYDRLKDLMRK